MKVTAKVDPGKGTVTQSRFPTLKAARAMVRGPYVRDSRIVLIPERGEEEIYERGSGGLRDRRVR